MRKWKIWKKEEFIIIPSPFNITRVDFEKEKVACKRCKHPR